MDQTLPYHSAVYGKLVVKSTQCGTRASSAAKTQALAGAGSEEDQEAKTREAQAQKNQEVQGAEPPEHAKIP